MPTPVVIDTDIGSDADDAIALAIAVTAPELEVAAVTTVTAPAALRAAVARAVLDAAGRADVRVTCGREDAQPSSTYRSHHPRGLWFGHEGRGVLELSVIDDLASTQCEDGAPDELADAMARHPRLRVLAIGPCTNVGRVGPTAGAELVTVGGMVRREAMIGGLALPNRAEFNFGADPGAAVQALQRWPALIVPTEITYGTWITPADVATLTAAGGLAATVGRLVSEWTPVLQERTADRGVDPAVVAQIACHLHDPLAVVALIEPGLVTTEDVHIRFESVDGELHVRESDSGGHAVRLVVDVDAAGVREAVMDRLLGHTG